MELVFSRTVLLDVGPRAGFRRGQAVSGLDRAPGGRQWRRAAVAERRGAGSLVEGLTGAVESGLAKLQRVLRGRPAGFPPGALVTTPLFS